MKPVGGSTARWLAGASALVILFVGWRFWPRGDVGGVSTPIGVATTIPIALPEGTSLTFPLHIGRVAVRGNRYDDILLRIEMLRDDAVLSTVECTAFRGGPRNAGRGVSVSRNECAATIPRGGAEAVRITPRLRHGHGGTEVSGLSVYLSSVQR